MSCLTSSVRFILGVDVGVPLVGAAALHTVPPPVAGELGLVQDVLLQGRDLSNAGTLLNLLHLLPLVNTPPLGLLHLKMNIYDTYA